MRPIWKEEALISFWKPYNVSWRKVLPGMVEHQTEIIRKLYCGSVRKPVSDPALLTSWRLTVTQKGPRLPELFSELWILVPAMDKKDRLENQGGCD